MWDRITKFYTHIHADLPYICTGYDLATSIRKPQQKKTVENAASNGLGSNSSAMAFLVPWPICGLLVFFTDFLLHALRSHGTPNRAPSAFLGSCGHFTMLYDFGGKNPQPWGLEIGNPIITKISNNSKMVLDREKVTLD